MHRGVNFLGEIEHALESCQSDLALVVVIAEADAELVGDGPFLDAADEQVQSFSCKECGEFERVGIVDDDGARIAELLQLLVVVLVAGLRADHAVVMPSVRRARTSEKALNAPPT